MNNPIEHFRLEMGITTDGEGNPIDDQAVIFIEGMDPSFQISVEAQCANTIAERIVVLWNAADWRSVECAPADVEVQLGWKGPVSGDWVQKVGLSRLERRATHWLPLPRGPEVSNGVFK